MKRAIHIHRLLAVFLVASLVLAPLAARAKVDSLAPVAVAAMVDEAASMAKDMPCCPEKSAPADCADCPLMAICAATTWQAPLAAGIAELRPVVLRALRPCSDPEADSLGYSPPPRPPRSLDVSA